MDTYGNFVILSFEFRGWSYSLTAQNPPAVMSPGGSIFFKGKQYR